MNHDQFLEDRLRAAEFDPDQLKRLMVAAFELLGKPEGQAGELARAILRAAEPLDANADAVRVNVEHFIGGLPRPEPVNRSPTSTHSTHAHPADVYRQR
jgi:hypothetical protein